MLHVMIDEILPMKNNIQFVDYIFERCDRACFLLPNFAQKKTGNKMKMNKDYKKYLDSIKEVLDVIRPHIIHQKIGKNYFCMKYPYASNIIMFKLDKEFRHKMLDFPNLYEWKYPQLPEDLCFIAKGSNTCWLEVVAHEKCCYFFNENNKDIEILKECGVNYFVGTGVFKVETPSLDFFD